MGIAERRCREKRALRTRIIEAARDIVSEEGLDALSMRAIAERVEYSPATLYLYFRDKEELTREVVIEGFRRLSEYAREHLERAGADASVTEQHRALGRAYVRFALENTAYFRVMFELPSIARVGPGPCPGAEPTDPSHDSWCTLMETMRKGIDDGTLDLPSAEHGALVSWALLHGLTSLYLGGHLRSIVESNEDFLALVETAMTTARTGWCPAGPGPTAS